MPDSLIHLEIITPDKVIFNGDVKSFTAPGTEGSFQILPRHAPFISTIMPGPVKFVSEDDAVKKFATSGGAVEVHKNKITMLAETIEPSDKIDVTRAEASKERALKRLKSKEPGTDIERAKLALLKALTRIKVAQTI